MPDNQTEVILEAPAVQTDASQRNYRAALLRQLYPHGVAPDDYADALFTLEVAERVRPVVVATELRRMTQASPVLPSPPEAPKPSPPVQPAMSKGAQMMIKLIEDHPRISIDTLAEKLEYKPGYILQLISECRKHNYVIDTVTDAKARPRYTLVPMPMRESLQPAPSVQ